MFDRLSLSDAFADMWRRSRTDAGKTQDYMAKSLGVSKATIQNWESGISCPNQVHAFEWFSVLGLQPLPYYLGILYPAEFGDISPESNDGDITQALHKLIDGMSPEVRRKILFVLYGDHGSSPFSVLEMVVAHLQTPLHDRLGIAQDIFRNYEICKYKGTLRSPKHIQPDMEALDKAYKRAMQAVIAGKESYNTIGADD